MRIACVALLLFPIAVLSAAGPSRVQLAVNEAAKRVDVTIDGKPFTSYIWPSTLKKPVLYPAAHRERHARHARLPARSAPGRAGRSPAPRRPVAEPRRRQRARLLEQLRRHSGGAGAEDGARSSPPRSSSAKSGGDRGRADGRDRVDDARQQAAAARRRRASCSAAAPTRAPSIASPR